MDSAYSRLFQAEHPETYSSQAFSQRPLKVKWFSTGDRQLHALQGRSLLRAISQHQLNSTSEKADLAPGQEDTKAEI